MAASPTSPARRQSSFHSPRFEGAPKKMTSCKGYRKNASMPLRTRTPENGGVSPKRPFLDAWTRSPQRLILRAPANLSSRPTSSSRTSAGQIPSEKSKLCSGPLLKRCNLSGKPPAPRFDGIRPRSFGQNLETPASDPHEMTPRRTATDLDVARALIGVQCLTSFSRPVSFPKW
jgi:hypothetical protein